MLLTLSGGTYHRVTLIPPATKLPVSAIRHRCCRVAAHLAAVCRTDTAPAVGPARWRPDIAADRNRILPSASIAARCCGLRGPGGSRVQNSSWEIFASRVRLSDAEFSQRYIDYISVKSEPGESLIYHLPSMLRFI